ncbi:hypothetical protein TNCV_4609071 [Trichonephila clavipes]|nr:hypothetical protein TNCV_4609071 [Trichonephila clavipes]
MVKTSTTSELAPSSPNFYAMRTRDLSAMTDLTCVSPSKRQEFQVAHYGLRSFELLSSDEEDTGISLYPSLNMTTMPRGGLRASTNLTSIGPSTWLAFSATRVQIPDTPATIL